jgi:hypothetical protein
VIRQVRESDMELEPARPSSVATTQSSPTLAPTVPGHQDNLEDIPEDDMMSGADSSSANEKSSSGSFKQQALRNSKGKEFWDKFDDTHRTPPPPAFLPRGSSSGISDDLSMDSSLSTPPSMYTGMGPIFGPSSHVGDPPSSPARSATPQPTAAEIHRKVTNKRRRDDDFDPSSFKRRAVSPGMSVHNSPVTQSPMQRDGSASSGNSGGNLWGRKEEGAGKPTGNGLKRVGLQGMVDTNDGLMKMSIE